MVRDSATSPLRGHDGRGPVGGHAPGWARIARRVVRNVQPQRDGTAGKCGGAVRAAHWVPTRGNRVADVGAEVGELVAEVAEVFRQLIGVAFPEQPNDSGTQASGLQWCQHERGGVRVTQECVVPGERDRQPAATASSVQAMNSANRGLLLDGPCFLRRCRRCAAPLADAAVVVDRTPWWRRLSRDRRPSIRESATWYESASSCGPPPACPRGGTSHWARSSSFSARERLLGSAGCRESHFSGVTGDHRRQPHDPRIAHIQRCAARRRSIWNSE